MRGRQGDFQPPRHLFSELEGIWQLEVGDRESPMVGHPTWVGGHHYVW